MAGTGQGSPMPVLGHNPENWEFGDLNTAMMAALMAANYKQLARQREQGNGDLDSGQTDVTPTVTSSPITTIVNRTDHNPSPLINEEKGIHIIIINQIVILVVFILLEIILFLTYRILIHHNKLDYKKRTIARLLLIAFPIMELIIYSIIFFSNFDRFLGGMLLLAITLILLIFSVGVVYISDGIDKHDSSISSDEYGHSSKLCSGWTPSRIRWNSTVNVSKIATTGTNAPTDDSLLVTGDGHGDGQSTGRNITQCSDVPLKTWNSKEMTNLEPKNQSSPKPRKSSRPPSRVGTPSRAVTPSILKSPNGRPPVNRSLNKSITIPVSPYKKGSTPTKKELLPPLKAKRNLKTALNESEIEKLKGKWNNSYNQEIGQTVETLEVNKLKKSVK